MRAIAHESSSHTAGGPPRDDDAVSPPITEQRTLDEDVAIEFRNVSKVYGGARARQPVSAVRNVNLSVRRGEVLCLMGASGSGKSTLLRQVNRLIEPGDGLLFVNGISVSDLSADALRELRSRRMTFRPFR